MAWCWHEIIEHRSQLLAHLNLTIKYRLDPEVDMYMLDLKLLLSIHGLQDSKGGVLALSPVGMLHHDTQPIDVKPDVAIQTLQVGGVVLELVQVLDVLDILLEPDYVVPGLVEGTAHHRLEYLDELRVVEMVVPRQHLRIHDSSLVPNLVVVDNVMGLRSGVKLVICVDSL